MASTTTEFGKLRSIFWPIHRHEVKMIAPMFLMLFLICFSYSILRNMKDTIVITAESSGAEVIPFIKVWALLPMAILVTFIFTKLTNRYSQEKVFYLITSGFLFFFALFIYVLFPMRDYLHPHQLAIQLEAVFPAGCKGLIMMCRYWSYTLFYVMSELWGSAVLSVLFWGFANEVTKVNDSRRFYSILGVGSNIAGVIAGQAANFFANPGSWEKTMLVLINIILVCGVIVMALFRWLNVNVLNDPSYDTLHKANQEFKKKNKLGMRESFSYLSNSKYLVCIAVLVLSYNLVINLVEIVWKDQLKQLYPKPSDYNTYMNNLTSAVGIVSAFVSFFLSRMIKRFGWTTTSLITPAIMMVTSLGFFSFLLFKDFFSGFVSYPLGIVVFFGAAQVCLSKAAKYSAFDTTKEIAFIPLDHMTKLKGKAAIDGVGSRLGKSGGSLIHQGLLMIFGTISKSAPYVAIILSGVIGLWMIATRSLGRQFNQLVSSETDQPETTPVLQPVKAI